MGFSGVWVVWSLLGAPGEKKRENQMYLQNYLAKFSKILQNFARNQRFSQKSVFFFFFAKFRKFRKKKLQNLAIFYKILQQFQKIS